MKQPAFDSASEPRYKVGEVASLTGLTIRTLHHFDAIGLLSPAHRDPSGYRRYSRADLVLLQEVLVLREFGMPLDQIRKVLQAPDHQPSVVLKAQLDVLEARRSELSHLIETLKKTIQNLEESMPISESDLYNGLSAGSIAELNAEVDARYDPALVAESRRRTRSWSAEQWKSIQAEGTRIETGLAARMHLDPGHPDVQALVRLHHAWVNHFYPCSIAIYQGLAALYVEDDRFRERYERIAPGFAAFLSTSMQVYTSQPEGNT